MKPTDKSTISVLEGLINNIKSGNVEVTKRSGMPVGASSAILTLHIKGSLVAGAIEGSKNETH